MNTRTRFFLVIASLLTAPAGPVVAQETVEVDLMTATGAQTMAASWRYADVRIVAAPFRAAGGDGQPTGAPVTTYDYEPHAGWADYDDSAWPVIAPESLVERRGNGKLAFNWYRTRLTIPDRIGAFATRGSTLWFETSVDDYAEVWVDGEIARAPAQSGGSVVAGWNGSNRLVIGRDLRPGQQIQLAVFGMNGPISSVPTNFIWMRTARLQFVQGQPTPIAVPPHEVNIEVVRIDPAIDQIVPANAKLYKHAEGFQFIEGPVWDAEHGLFFSDPNENRIYRYDGETLLVHREQSGYAGADVARYRQPGSNGLALDREGRLIVAEHGNRRVSRIEPDGGVTVLAANDRGRRLNSPNDIVLSRNGTVYFTDPPFGLPGFDADPARQLRYSGIYRIAGGRAELLARDLAGPNGIALSPDERFLYVGNWDTARKVVMRYPVRRDGRLGKGTELFDMTAAPGEEAIDGVEVDRNGNLYVSGPGGVWIISDDGRHLGTLRTPRLPANFAWGGAERRTLYLTARSALYSIELLIPGSTQ